MRGFFEIGIYNTKTVANVGTLWRSAYQLGAAGIFTVGLRMKKQSSDTGKAWRHIPLRKYVTLDEWHAALPVDTPVVGIEMGGKSLAEFWHPERAIYLLGAEDSGLTDKALGMCHHVVTLDAVRTPSFNVAVAGSLVLYHRLEQMRQIAKEGW